MGPPLPTSTPMVRVWADHSPVAGSSDSGAVGFWPRDASLLQCPCPGLRLRPVDAYFYGPERASSHVRSTAAAPPTRLFHCRWRDRRRDGATRRRVGDRQVDDLGDLPTRGVVVLAEVRAR